MDIFFLLLIGVTGVLTYKGLQSLDFQDKYLFSSEGIRIYKQHYRLITSGFLHSDWMHFAFNMLALYFIGKALLVSVGIFPFLLIYFLAIVGGNWFSLWFYRNQSDYRALGASGGVSGVVFAFICLMPTGWLSVFFLPLPNWLFAIAYLGISMYGLFRSGGRISHSGHLGGMITGILLTILIRPTALVQNWWIFLLLLLPVAIFAYLSIYQPQLFLGISFDRFKRSRRNMKVVQSPRMRKKAAPDLPPQAELDTLLDKIAAKGYESLSSAERERLKVLSDRLKR